MQRVLRPTGSLVVNIKEHCEDGERHRYVYELVLAMRDAGWRLVDELIWHKKNSMPGKFPGRFRDAFERLYHFTLAKGHYCDKEAVKRPALPGAIKRYERAVRNNEVERRDSRNGSGFGVTRAYKSSTASGLAAGPEDQLARKGGEHWRWAQPSNVLHMATESHNKGHSAAFPNALPEFFIKAFSPPGGVVLDPFAGSGTTLQVAARLGREYIGVERDERYHRLATERLAAEAPLLGEARRGGLRGAAGPARRG